MRHEKRNSEFCLLVVFFPCSPNDTPLPWDMREFHHAPLRSLTERSRHISPPQMSSWVCHACNREKQKLNFFTLCKRTHNGTARFLILQVTFFVCLNHFWHASTCWINEQNSLHGSLCTHSFGIIPLHLQSGLKIEANTEQLLCNWL